MNAAVVDGKANFVQPRRPAEDGAIGLYLHLPGLLQGIEQRQHALLHPGGLFAVHPVVGTERLCGTLANIVVLQALLELIQQSFAQRTIGVVEPLDGQRGKQAEQDGDRSGKHLLTLLGKPCQLEVIDSLALNHHRLEPLQPLQRNTAIGQSLTLQHVAHGADRT